MRSNGRSVGIEGHGKVSDMERKTKIMVVMAAIAIVLGIALLIGSITTHEKCLVWRNVEEKMNISQTEGYFIAITDSPLSLMLPVDSDTYSFVKVNQSYNFYCHISLGQDWKCHFSYECGECKECQYLQYQGW